ncbi:cyclophilin-like fold protein [Agromyces mariniharenae]|uniref:Cyclophilin-like domain-containing protein n=1 Tax=Agromyces mariniharenae TaxID=2604423 RepID=A0A5S4VJ66_9MICO|nr:cyclophilin-like fold protein [Agromyces mariniharenae]TYL54175.1 hypothetical protein FYC51_11390 [Agromyces mariniharenae]
MTFRMLAPIVAALLLAGAPAFTPDRPATETVAELDPATGFEQRLSVALELDDRMGAAQVAQLPAALETATATPVTSYRVGDVAYWPAGQSLIVFLFDGAAEPSDGLVGIGRVTSGIERLADCVRDCPLRLTAAAR